MKSLFNANAYSEITNRIEHLTPNSKRLWGKMNVSQMLYHCQKPITVALGKETVKTSLLFNWASKLYKPMFYNDKPWKQGLPTAKEFIIKDNRNFNTEQNNLLQLVAEMHQQKDKENLPPHPVFGKFTKEQWGQMQYKHLDHHLRQFGG